MKILLSVLFLSLALGLGLSGSARADVACTVDLFTPGYGTCTDNGTNHIFSNFVCQYQKIISQIMDQVYCGMVDSLTDPLYSVLTLFVVFLGAGILIGTTQFTARELMLALFKIALVVAFATQAEFLINILYKGLIGFISGGVDLVMSSATDTTQTGGSANGLLENIDKIINDFLMNAAGQSTKGATDGDQCKGSPVPLFFTFLISAPPLFALGAGMVFKLMLVFIRAIVGYLFAVTIIMFLVSLAPIFLSLGLFAATRSFFEKWVQYLMSSALQIVVVFAFIGFVLSMGLEGEFKKVVNLSVPFNGGMWQEGQRQSYTNFCTLPSNIDPATGAGSGDAVPPSGMWKVPDILRLVGTQMFKLLLLAMLVEKTLEMAPEIARKLGGLDTAPSLGGRGASGNIEMQGSQVFQSMTGGISRGFGSGGSLPTRLGASASQGYTGFMRGEGAQGGAVSEFARSLLGLR